MLKQRITPAALQPVKYAVWPDGTWCELSEVHEISVDYTLMHG